MDSSQKGPFGLSVKEPPFGSGTHPCESSNRAETKTLDLNGILARVDRINVEGVLRTKDDVIQNSVKDLFKAQNFEEMIMSAHQIGGKLKRLGCFQNVTIHIDTSNGPGATPNGYEVTYTVNELRRISGGVTTQVSNNEGVLVVNMGLPNVFGRGESLKGEYSYGSKRTKSFNVSLLKPFVSAHDFVGSLNAFQNDAEFPVSGFKVIDRGLLLDLGFNSFSKVKHNVQWEGSWRELGVGTKYASFEVREDAGNTLKSSIRHIVALDRRDTVIFPTCGSLWKLVTEFAGLGGNVGFIKNELNVQGNWSIFNKDIILQFSLNGGIMNFVDENKPPLVCDNFFLGGPISLRGFDFRGVGPQADGNYVGGEVYWSSGLHLYSPLPFKPGSGGFGDQVKLHLFMNAGRLFKNVEETKYSDLKACFEDQKASTRLAGGVGLALKLGQMARVELNYCFPIWFLDTDAKVEGFQIGVGINFV